MAAASSESLESLRGLDQAEPNRDSGESTSGGELRCNRTPAYEVEGFPGRRRGDTVVLRQTDRRESNLTNAPQSGMSKR